MKVIGLFGDGCPKCEDAKFILQEYNIEWINIETTEGAMLAHGLCVEYTPFFIYGDENSLDINVEQSYLRMVKILEKNKDK